MGNNIFSTKMTKNDLIFCGNIGYVKYDILLLINGFLNFKISNDIILLIIKFYVYQYSWTTINRIHFLRRSNNTILLLRDQLVPEFAYCMTNYSKKSLIFQYFIEVLRLHNYLWITLEPHKSNLKNREKQNKINEKDKQTINIRFSTKYKNNKFNIISIKINYKENYVIIGRLHGKKIKKYINSSYFYIVGVGLISKYDKVKLLNNY